MHHRTTFVLIVMALSALAALFSIAPDEPARVAAARDESPVGTVGARASWN